MRKILAVVCVLIFCGTAYAAKYPAMGVCNAERVRLRASPGTKGKFLGFVEPGRNRFVILGEAYSDSYSFWYDKDGLYQASIQEDAKKALAWIHVGDKAEKLSDLGIPVAALEVWEGEEFELPYGDYVYKDKDTDEQIVFVFVGRNAKNAVINSMIWSRPRNKD